MSIKSLTSTYFNAINELIENPKKPFGKTVLNGLCVASYFTFLPPFTLGVMLGVSKLHGRITKKPGPSQAGPVSNWTWANRFQANVLRSRSAQYRVAVSLFNGSGVAENKEEAIKLLKSAAKSSPKAQYELASLYNEGADGLPQDSVVALKYLTKAANQGHADAQDSLGDVYFNRVSRTPEDLETAVNWYKKSAAKGNPSAQHSLGMCFLYGDGIAQNSVEALKYLTKSAEQDYLFAKQRLGNIFYRGSVGIPENDTFAIKWYKRVVAQLPNDREANQALQHYTNIGINIYDPIYQ